MNIDLTKNKKTESAIETNGSDQPNKLSPIAESLESISLKSLYASSNTNTALTNRAGIINIESLAIPAHFGEKFAVSKILSNVPIRKPLKATFFRVNADQTFGINIYEDKLSGITYALSLPIAEFVPEIARTVCLHRAIDRQGNQFLIPVSLQGPDGRSNSWHESLNFAVEKAKYKWIRVAANMRIGEYDIFEAKNKLDDPLWSEHSLVQLIEIGFQGKVIDDEKHPVIQQLLGNT